MPQIAWHADSSGAYWIDVYLAGRLLPVLVDTGLIDVQGDVGFSVDETLYDDIKQAGALANFQDHPRLTADGRISVTESGMLDAQLASPHTNMPVGPLVRVRVYRGAPGVPDRVGLAFFHRLSGCRVQWDLDLRIWCIEYP